MPHVADGDDGAADVRCSLTWWKGNGLLDINFPSDLLNLMRLFVNLITQQKNKTSFISVNKRSKKKRSRRNQPDSSDARALNFAFLVTKQKASHILFLVPKYL